MTLIQFSKLGFCDSPIDIRASASAGMCRNVRECEGMCASVRECAGVWGSVRE